MGSLSEEDDRFFDTREEVTSVSDSSSDIGEKSDSESRVGGDAFSNNFGYEVWIKNPGTIGERRRRLLNLMGLSAKQVDGETNSQGFGDDEGGMDNSRVVEESGAVLRSSFPISHSSSQSSISCGSTDSLDLFIGELDENSVCRIKNLDNGTEFIIDELGQDGLLRKLREVGSDRPVTGEQFEKILGLSPLVQQVMRKSGGLAPNSGSLTKRQAKKGWLRRLGATACVVDVRAGVSPIGASGLSPISGVKTQTVRVRTSKKRAKELSALYMAQDVVAHKGAILTMKFSPDGWFLATAGEDGIVRVWPVNEEERFRAIRISNVESNIYFTINDRSELLPLYVDKERSKSKGLRKSSESACVIFPQKVFHMAVKPVHEFHGHHGEVLDLSWSKDKHLISSSVDKTVRLWKIGVDQCLKVFSHNNYVTCVQFSPMDDKHFISGSIDGKVRIWKVDGCEVVDWIDIREIVTALCYQPDGKGAVVGSIVGDCVFFDTSDNQLQIVDKICLQGKKKSPLRRITGFQFSPVDSGKLLVTSADSHVRILQRSDVISKYRGLRNTGSQISASFTSDGTHIISASEDSNVYMWNHVGSDGSVSSPSSSHHMKSAWSCERFLSNNASVAIPWCGTPSGNSILHSAPGGASQSSKHSGIAVRYMAENKLGGPQQHVSGESNSHSRFPLSLPDTLSLGFSDPPFCKGIATWPEEKLPSSASLVVSSSACKSDYKFVKTACQDMVGSNHAWGMVIVTAGWDGKIRVFQNYGLPIHV